MKRVLITGIAGSGGSYLTEYIAKSYPEIDISGIARWHSTSLNNLASTHGKTTIYEADMTDFGSILAVLKSSDPDTIFHLASGANVKSSFLVPISIINNNVMGTVNLLEAIRMAGINPTIHICSSSEVYGQVDESDVPITESQPLCPVSPYAVSKATQDLLGGSYFASYGMRVIRTRMFTYINPRRADLFASSFARQVARIEHGLQDILCHGNLDSVRTVFDVRDAMRAYAESILHCKPGEVYNIGGTKSISVGDFLSRLIDMSVVEIPTRPDKSLFRPADVTLQIPCIDKFRECTGFEQEYTFEESIGYLLKYWRREAYKEYASSH